MIGGAILLLSAVVVITFVHKYDNTRPILQESFQQIPINISDIENLKGNIVSLQNNDSGMPAWIISGRWKIIETPNDNTTGNKLFSANLTMVRTDGTSEHRHRLSEFTSSGVELKNRTATINGFTTLTTLGSDASSGIPNTPIKNLPIIIKIFNLRTITIDIDKSKINHHFGNSPIFGTVTG
jgi:hypothetical protein